MRLYRNYLFMLIQTKQQFARVDPDAPLNAQDAPNIHDAKEHFDRVKNKTEEQSSSGPSRNTSPTNKSPTDESTFVREQRRKCANCLESQRVIAGLERQLTHQRKKIAKYSKIIQAKIDKQRQLQQAYSQIAIQLRKKMEYAMKNEPSGHLSNIIVRQSDQNSQELKRVQQQLAEKAQMAQILNDKISSQNGSATLLKMGRRRQMGLQRQVTELCVSQMLKKSRLSIFHYSLAVRSPYWQLQDLDSIKPNHYQCEEQTSEEKCLNLHNQNEDSQAVEDYIFDKKDHSCSLSSYKFNDESLIKEEDNRWSSSKTVNQIQQSLSFHSLYSRPSMVMAFQPKPLQENRKKDTKVQVGSQFYSIQQSELSISGVSNVQAKDCFCLEKGRKSDNQWLDNIVQEGRRDYQSRQCGDRKEGKDGHLAIRERPLFNITQHLKGFIQGMSDKYNQTGKRSNPSYDIPSLMVNVFRKDGNDKKSSTGAYQVVQNSQFKDLLSSIFGQLQALFKNQKKEYERMLNNNRLQLANQQARLEEEKAERQRLERMIEGYQFHKSLFDLNQLEEQEKSRTYLVSETKVVGKNSELLTSVQKKLHNIKQSKMRNQQTDCSIIPTDIMDKYRYLEQRNFELLDALSCLPKFLIGIHKDGQYLLNFGEGVNQQIQDMLKRFIQYLLQGRQKQNTDILRRACSSSVCIPSLTFPTKSESLVGSGLLQTEKQRLKALLREKSEEILKLSQKITLQNIERANCQKTIQNLRIQIYSLNEEAKAKKMGNSHFKFDNQYKVVPATPNLPQVSPSKSSQFMDFQVKQQYNNLYWEKDRQLQDLRQKVASNEFQIKKCHLEHKKKKKLIYINN